MTRQRVFLLVSKTPMLLFALFVLGNCLCMAYLKNQLAIVPGSILLTYLIICSALEKTPWQLPSVYELSSRVLQQISRFFRSK
ncbi:hypothetical protein HMPREF1487_09052 [Pseudomonas sp. HPB0071]|nr:hypothetical protein HMPREF1487_09052 [Pseudomonas sp. HPB0071]